MTRPNKITIAMSQFGTHGCGKTLVFDGEVYLEGDCPTCGEDGAMWSGSAHTAMESLLEAEGEEFERLAEMYAADVRENGNDDLFAVAQRLSKTT